jgi:hypothetical protein
VYVFSYGSLLDPESLSRTLPEVDLAACVPAVCRDYVRSFSVAFPNDGSEADKAYFDLHGARPDVVLFCDIQPAPRQRVNGICLPLDEIALEALRRRELRYDLADVTELTLAYPATHARLSGPVVTFMGKSRFTRPGDVDRGVVSADYLETVEGGAAYWDQRYPGFADDYRATTVSPDPSRVVALTRVDHVPSADEV